MKTPTRELHPEREGALATATPCSSVAGRKRWRLAHASASFPKPWPGLGDQDHLRELALRVDGHPQRHASKVDPVLVGFSGKGAAPSSSTGIAPAGQRTGRATGPGGYWPAVLPVAI